MDKVRYHEMLPHEIVARRKQCPVAFVGVGTLEWHGEHQAVGLDALKAEKLCEMAAAASGGFAMPTLWYGEPRTYKLMDANEDIGGKLMRRFMKFKKGKFVEKFFKKEADQQVGFFQELIYHLLLEMSQLEMKAVCLYCGHYPLVDFAQKPVEAFNAAQKDTKAFAGMEVDYCPGDKRVGGDHAAKWETSYLAALRPDCVDLTRWRGHESEECPLGVCGIDPRKEASAAMGREACRLIVEGMVRKAAGLLNGLGKE